MERINGDEEDNWAQDCADGAHNCPQDGPRYSQDGTESSPRYSQDWTESGPCYSQDRTEGGTCCPQDSAKAYIANSIANDKAGSPPRYRIERIRYLSVRLTRRRGFAVPFGLTVMGVLLASIDIASGNYNPETGIGLFTGIFALLTLIPTIIVYVKRFHDRDKSGWWVLISLIPIIGVIWLLIELGFLNARAEPIGPPVTE